MFIKICGLSTPETVAAAVREGADAVGFVLAPGYARTVSPEQVAALVREVPPEVETVGVFRGQSAPVVLDHARRAGVRTIQLHGNEPLSTAGAVLEAGFGLLRAFSAHDFAAMSPGERQFWGRKRILLDAVDPGAGETFDPDVLGGVRPAGFWLLAGGLDAGNVADLVAELRPTGVDVSSGVEVSRGRKSVERIAEFIRAARATRAGRAG